MIASPWENVAEIGVHKPMAVVVPRSTTITIVACRAGGGFGVLGGGRVPRFRLGNQVPFAEHKQPE